MTFLALFLGFMYLIAPLAVRGRLYHKKRAVFERLSPELLAHSVSEEYRRSALCIENLGFELLAHLRAVGHTPDTTSIVSLFVNRRSGETATVAHVLTQGPLVSPSSLFFEFDTDFEDGSVLETNNTGSPPVFHQVPGRQVVKVPHVRRPEDLYRIHRYLSAIKGGVPKLPPQGSEVEYFIDEMDRSLARQAEYGYFYLDPGTEAYCPTLKGAYLMSWRLLPPLSMLARALLARRGRQIALLAGIK